MVAGGLQHYKIPQNRNTAKYVVALLRSFIFIISPTCSQINDYIRQLSSFLMVSNQLGWIENYVPLIIINFAINLTVNCIAITLTLNFV